jgi:hypothetical protein
VLCIEATRGVGSADTSKELTVNSKKTPAPQRAGTAKKSKHRAAREVAIVAGLEKMRTDDPAAFLRLMRLLGRLVARTKVDRRSTLY